MPWIAGTALLHSALVMEKRNALKIWTIFLSIITFSLSLLGTFLVRSGILTSVHSFASDPTRGLVILTLLALFIGGAFALFAFRANSLRAGGLFAPISREGALILNNLFLATALGAVLTGTLYPLVLDALTGRTISVGPPFFNLTFGALFAPLLVVLPFGPFLAWKRGDLVAAAKRLAMAAAIAVLVLIVGMALTGTSISLAPLGLLLGAWVAFGAVADLIERGKVGRIAPAETFRRLAGLPRSAWSTAIAHLGLGLSIIGVVTASAWQGELVTTLVEGQSAELGGYRVTLDRLADDVPGPNYTADAATFTVTDPGGATRQPVAERRIYTANGTPTTEAAIETYGLSQLYLQLGEDDPAGGHVVRVWYKPYVTLIWLGAIVMALAGFLSLTDRRARVGVPRRAVAREPAAAE
jgi:cytochrome c-type biogenesis protein CcmF